MARGALGLIEVKGYLGAVVAADTALKAANVSLLNIESVKAGLRTVQITGDVGAVRSAVDAAVKHIRDKPYYLASHVIPRLNEQTELILQEKEKVKLNPESNSLENVDKLSSDVFSKNDVSDLSNEDEAILDKQYDRSKLEKLKVVDLRKIAYREKNIELTKKEIKFGNKITLVNALTNLERKE